LPRVGAKRPPVAVERNALVLSSASQVLLARRRPDVLFGGLWEPPSAAGGRAGLASLARSLGVEPASLGRGGELFHVLSHRRLRVEVTRGPLGRRRQWPLPGPDYDAVERVSFADLPARAHATLTRKVLAVAEVPSPV